MASTDNDDDLSYYSTLVSRDLHLAGKDATNAEYQRHATLISDFFISSKVYNMGVEYVYTAGSTAEGTSIYTSDQDAMISVRGIYILNEDAIVKGRYERIVFVRDSSRSRCGYTRLISSVHNKSLYHKYLENDFQNLIVTSQREKYLSSEWFRYLMQSMVPIEQGFPYEGVQHGPCVMLDMDSLYEVGGKNQDIDIAYAVPCHEWPEEANEWKTRARKHGWPSKAMIEDICKMKCQVVAVGDSGSDTSHLEWRQSFLLSERYLVWKFNDTQIQCYVILKQLCRSYIEVLAPNQVSSYNLKTVMFWIAEEFGTEIWTRENLLKCVCLCLRRLSKSVESKHLSHYFLREANLFEYKFDTLSQRQTVVERIQNLLSDIVRCVMRCGLPSETRLYKVYEECDGDYSIFKSRVLLIVNLGEKYAKIMRQQKTISKYHIILQVFKRHTSNFYGTQDKEAVLSALYLANPQITEAPESFSMPIGCYVNIRKGFTFFQRWKSTDDQSKKTKLAELAFATLEMGSKLDQLSGPLYLATYYLQTGYTEKCISTVQSTLKLLPKRMMYIGLCSNNQYVENEKGKLFPVSEVKSGENIEHLPVIFDILFSREDYIFAPPYLVYSCALLPRFGDSYLTIHPCIYALFLLHYATFLKEGPDHQDTQVTLNNLVDYLSANADTRYSFHAHNLLACCYGHFGKVVEMFAHFIVSLRMTSGMPRVQNPAAWHLALTVFHNQSAFK